MMENILYYGHRPNCYPVAPDTQSFEEQLSEGLAAGVDGIVFGQWAGGWPFLTNADKEEALKQRIHAALTRCDEAGVKVWIETQDIARCNDRESPSYLPTIRPDAANLTVVDLLRGAMETGESPAYELPVNGRMILPIACEPWRYYDCTVFVVAADPSAKLGTLGFYRRGDDGEYHKVSYQNLVPGVNRAQFHSLDCADWALMVHSAASALVVIPCWLRERIPSEAEVLGEADDSAAWNCERPMYRLRPACDARDFKCRAADLSDLVSRWNGYGVAVDQWRWLASLGHGCLQGWFGNGNEPSGMGYQGGLGGPSAGEQFAQHADDFCRIGKLVTGQPVVLFADPFDPNHNGGQYRRANNPAGGGFATAPGAVRADIPAIFAVWNENKIEVLEQSVSYWAKSGHRWWPAMHVEDTIHAQAAELIRALPVEQQPEAVFHFTWDTRLVRADNLRAKMGFFN